MKRIITLLFMFCALSLSAQKGKLNKAKSKLKGSSSSSKKSKSNSSSGDDDYEYDGSYYDDETNEESEFVISALELVVEGLYYATVPTLFGEADWTELNIYPYYDGSPGEYTGWVETDSVSGFSTNHLYEFKKSDLRANLNYFSGGSVNGLQAKVDFRPVFLIGLDVSYSHLYEDVIDERVYLDVMSIMANYYRVRTKHVTGWWGIGYTRIANDVDEGGFAYQLGVDVFPVKPWSFGVFFKQSFINETYWNELHVQAKYNIKRLAPYIGWHYNNIGGVDIGGMALGVQYIIN